MIRVLYAVALFVSAMLLFLIQPMIAKMILPLLGGTPAVWNTCLVFFQATLLAGYLYAHGSARFFAPRRQSFWHLGLLVLPFLTLPLLLFPLRLLQGTSFSSTTTPALAVLDKLGIYSSLLQVPDPARPILWLLLVLIVCVSLPFFVVSATAPLLQHWFAATGQPDSQDPYFLYAASNSGSILALLAYPVIVEPYLTLQNQVWAWSVGYGLLVVLIACCALVLWMQRPEVKDQRSEPGASATGQESGVKSQDSEMRNQRLEKVHDSHSSSLTLDRRLRWLMLAAIPSSLLLGVTTFLSTNVAPVPLLWIIPLTLYLLTFVLVFSRSPLISNQLVGRILPIVILVQTFVFAIELKRGAWILFMLHLGCFFLTALFCHGRLAEDRPNPRHLTEFYLWIAAGGVLGGLFNVLIAPLVFNGLVEYPLALVLACLFLPSQAYRPSRSRLLSGAASPVRQTAPTRGRMIYRASSSASSSETTTEDVRTIPILTWGDLWFPILLGLLMFALVFALELAGTEALWLKATLLIGLPAAIAYAFIGRPVRFALGIGALLLVGGISRGILHIDLIHQERSFFGVMTVLDKSAESDSPTKFRVFVHGNTNHGQQNIDPAHHRDPLAYYSRTGPIGQLFDSLSKGPTKKRVAVLGLGAGALACYAEKDQDWTFYEIDPAVESIARTYFTFLQDAVDRGVHVKVIKGDGRLLLAKAPDPSFDLIFADAFSSDAVPIHLLTRQALELYLSKLTDGGLIVFNVTNRYVDLEPVLGTLAAHAGLVCISQKEDAHRLTKAEEIEGKVAAHWIVMARQESDLGSLAENPAWKEVPPGPVEWTDDYSNLLGVFRW
jgi:hypothetical protein